jgi:hypothetical protein
VTHFHVESLAADVYGPGNPGASTDIERTADGRHLLQPLAGYTMDRAIQRRDANHYENDGAFVVSDDVGGVSTGAMTMRDFARGLRISVGQRFEGLLDTDVLVRYVDDLGGFFQQDLDGATDGIQGVALPAAAAGAYLVGRSFGLFVP